MDISVKFASNEKGLFSVETKTKNKYLAANRPNIRVKMG
jgi:hypothetical protein